MWTSRTVQKHWKVLHLVKYARKTNCPTEPHGLISLPANSCYSNRSFIGLSQARGLECAAAKKHSVPSCAGRCRANVQIPPAGWKGSFVLRIDLPGQCALLLENLWCAELKTGDDTFIAEPGYKKDQPSSPPPPPWKSSAIQGESPFAANELLDLLGPRGSEGAAIGRQGVSRSHGHTGPLTCGQIDSTPRSLWIATVSYFLLVFSFRGAS